MAGRTQEDVSIRIHFVSSCISGRARGRSISLQSPMVTNAPFVEVISQPITVGDNVCHVGASIGISLFPESAWDARSLLRLADDAMYHAKANGKNRFSLAQRAVETP